MKKTALFEITGRQGDILIMSEEEYERLKAHILADAQEMYAFDPATQAERAGRIILEGESTGHAHRLVGGRVLQDAQGHLLLECLKATQIVHDEHHRIALEPMAYKVIRQREYSPEEIRTVVD